MDYIIKTESVVEVINSIKSVYNNKLNLRPEVGEKILGEISRLKSKEASMIETLNIMSKLTNAEYEVLKSLYQGKTYRQIARERYVEQATLRCQVSRIIKKFGKGRISDIIKILKQLKIFDIYS
jgi:DNA-binding NarL/FixJ family response regulator